MNLLQVIHQRWAADATLNGLLPATKVSTGTFFADDPVFPYGTITLPGSQPDMAFNDGTSAEQVTIRITIYHQRSNYDKGAAIAEAVRDVFNRKQFDLSGSDKCLLMNREGYEELDDPDAGHWFFISDFICTVFLA